MKQKKCFVFCHGFAFDSSFWEPLSSYLSDYNTVYLDLGYFSAVRGVEYDSSIEYIGIGHSLGLMKLISSDIPFSVLIGLHGFVNFLGLQHSLRNRRNRELMSLIKNFQISAVQTLQQFYQRTGVAFDLSKKNLNQIKLLSDLNSLMGCVELPRDIPVLILGTDNDKIVPPELIEDNFKIYDNVKITILNQCHHGLGHLQPDLIYQQIKYYG